MSAVAVGVLVGLLFGMLGVGGSAFATPLLRLVLGVPPLVAVATPLVATIPSALAGAFGYVRRGIWSRRVATISAVAGIPGVVLGALASDVVSGVALLVLSGFFLLAVGVRLLWPGAVRVPREPRTTPLSVGTFFVGFFSGLLANGGGFLLIPLFVLVLGLDMHVAAATSLVVVAAYSIPGLALHAALGHIDWWLAARFAAGSIPAAYLGSLIGLRTHPDRLRRGFGVLLVGFSVYFIVRQLP